MSRDKRGGSAARPVTVAYRNLEVVLDEVAALRNKFAATCQDAHDNGGLSDQQIADITKSAGEGYSRARIQQFRKLVAT